MAVIFGFVARYFWLLAIGVNMLNALLIWGRVQDEIRMTPSLAPGYLRLVIGYAIWTSVPFIVMGVGILWGGLPHIFYFLNPSSGNLFVLLFWVVNFSMYAIIGTYWLFFGGGIAYLEKHPGIMNTTAPLNSARFKIQWLIQVFGIVVGFMVLYFLADIRFAEIPFLGSE